MLNPLVTPLVKNVAGYLLTNALPGNSRRTSRSSLIGSLTKGLSLPTLLVVGFVAGYGYKTFADPEVHEPTPEVARRPGEMGWQLYFSPNGGCTDAVVRELRAAQRDVRVMAYSFTSKPIAQALVDCVRRGVKVEVILDKGQKGEAYTEADFIAGAGIPTYMDGKHAIHHNKVVIIDDHTVITGSFNFTSSAEQRNAENLLVLRDSELVARYRHEWQRHQMHSERHIARGAGYAQQSPPPAKSPGQSSTSWLPWRPGK